MTAGRPGEAPAACGRALDFAIVGSGPSGFYAAEALLRADPDCRIDMLERLPTPHGLVRGGVAPDHPKTKQVAVAFDRIAKSPRFRFRGNVSVGTDVSVDELLGLYDSVVLACGAAHDVPLGIPGERLPGVVPAGEFVGWYNAHPDHSHRQFDLDHETAVVIGHGNVAADICRMLLTPVGNLARTDIPDYALQALEGSRIREVHLIGRRGPAQASFTNPELRELGAIPDCDAMVDPSDLELGPASRQEIGDPDNEVKARNVEIFARFASSSGSGRRRCRFRFHENPLRFEGSPRLERLVVEKGRLTGPPFRQRTVPTGSETAIPCGLAFHCIGFRAMPLPGVPFDEKLGVFCSSEGRVMRAGSPIHGLYATGWSGRGASGVIGTNRAHSHAVVQSLLGDIERSRRPGRPGAAGLDDLLVSRAVRWVDHDDWLTLDRTEVERGKTRGKSREKLRSVDQMLRMVGK
ncbi:MAG: FAD-dependent oxidoreductase [Lautropia sp.]